MMQNRALVKCVSRVTFVGLTVRKYVYRLANILLVAYLTTTSVRRGGTVLWSSP